MREVRNETNVVRVTVGKYKIEAHKQKTTEVRSVCDRKAEKQSKRDDAESGATAETGILILVFGAIALGVMAGVQEFSKDSTVALLKLLAHYIMSHLP